MNYAYPTDPHYYGWYFVFAVLRQHKYRAKLSDNWLISKLRLLKPIPEIWYLAAQELGRSGRWAAAWERHGVRVLPPETILGYQVPTTLPESLQQPNTPSPIPPPPGGAIDCKNPQETGELLLPNLPEIEPSLPVDDAVLRHIRVGVWLNNSSLEMEARLLITKGFSGYWNDLQSALVRNAKSQKCTPAQLVEDVWDGSALPPIPDPKKLRDDRIIQLRRAGRTHKDIAFQVGCSVPTVRRVLKRSTVTVH